MDTAKAIAREVVAVFEYLLKEEERRLAFEEVQRIVREALDERRQHIKPSQN